MCSANHCTWNEHIFFDFKYKFYMKRQWSLFYGCHFFNVYQTENWPLCHFSSKIIFLQLGDHFSTTKNDPRWLLSWEGVIIRLYDGLCSVIGSLKVTLTLIKADLFLINFMFTNSLSVNAVFFLMWLFIWSYPNLCFNSSYLTVDMF